jgi:L-asparaginase
MKKILIISTGGTFNKVYNPLNGELEIDITNQALKRLEKQWMVDFSIINIIGKDSLDMTEEDRKVVAKTVKNSSIENIIIIHGTDTMDKTAHYLATQNLDKKIILTGSMVPFSINPIEATANFSSAYGYLLSVEKTGVYIGMNGVIGLFNEIVKNREKGFFEVQ